MFHSFICKISNTLHVLEVQGYIGNDAMILWFLQEEYVNAHEVWIAIGKHDDILVMYSDSETAPLKPSLLLVSLLLMMDMPACFDQLYRRKRYRELVDAACTRATILRAKKSGWLVKQKESIVKTLDGRFPKELALIMVEYSHPSVYEIWFELEIDAATKKRRRVPNAIAPRRNPDRAARKKYAEAC